ncbi:Seven TM Receptor [Caenorhabditis elegans]|nr:Seven TM Receptor [Caenorhabditis elegans]CZR14588.1 Seven TM Receptor [Caenorhabditis elegans]|eukprot:NP_001309663.1 Seven TM Receptor [Caenorhabditis elegans]
MACCSVLFYGGFYGITLAILALHFIYRFLSITNNRHLNSFNSWKIILWFMGPPISGIIFMLTGAFIMSSNGDSDRFLSENYPTLLGNETKIEDLYYVGPFFWPKYNNFTTDQYFNWRTAGGAMIVMGLISLSIAIMVYFGVKGYRSMNKLIAQSNSSQKFRSVQKQLFNALVLQTFIPVLLMHIPASAIYFTIFFDKCTEYLGKIFTLTVAMYPTFNPLPTIFIVKNYRNALKDSLICVEDAVLRRSRTVHPSSTAYSVNTQVS